MYLQKNVYLITPVNPGHQYLGNLRCYPNLESIDHPIDIVNIFRKTEFVYDIVKSSIFIKAKAAWMQDSVYDKMAERLAIEEGIMVVMDDCILRQHKIFKGK
jgi:predicted CoA-binding protein